MKSIVYYGSPYQARWDEKETLPAKLDLILDRLHVRERVKDESVAIKVHVGGNISYSTIHPVFLRKVVAAVKNGGGHPFICDVNWDTFDAQTRGYTKEVLGCPVYPVAGVNDRYYYEHERPYKNIKTWKVAGMIEDASFLINFAHVKGHPMCGFGACFKNLALGCVVGQTRSEIHDTVHYDKYWFKELCPDDDTRKRIIDSCPFGAIIEDKDNPKELHVHFEPCNQCGRCLKVAPPGSLKIDPVNFHSFQEANAISVSQTLATFKPGKVVNLSLANQMTPLCDCFGFTTLPILPDAGIFGSDDIVAIDRAVLDVIAKTKLIEENVIGCMEVWNRDGHPYQRLHGPYKDPYKVTEYGEQLGLGSRDFELIDVYPVEKIKFAPLGYIPASK